MNEHYNRHMLDILPFGVGFIKLLNNGRTEAENFVFLDVNTAFEALTGLSRKCILGKPASIVLKDMTRGGFDWHSYFIGVSRYEKARETTQAAEVSGRRLAITVTPSGSGLLAAVIRNAAEGLAAPGQNSDDMLFDRNLEAVLNHTHDAVLLVEYKNGEFRNVRNNAVHQRLTGFYEIKGTTATGLLGEGPGQALHKYFEQCLSTGENIVFEQLFSFNPGNRVWQTEVARLFDHSGGCYLLCSSKDITDLKEAQEKNEGLTRRLQSMFERHSAVMLIFCPVSGRIIDANPAACDFYGYSKKELETITILDINMQSIGEFQDHCRKRIVNHETYFAIVPHRLKSGEIRLVDIYSCPITDGKHTFFYSILFDATDRERYRNELFLEKEMLETTLRSIGDGVVTTDNAGIIASLNSVAQEITGWDNGSAIGRPFTDVFVLQNEETGQPVENPVQKVLATGRIVGLANHTVLLNRQGGMVPIADSAAPIKAEDGQIFGVVMVFRDVSLEKEHTNQIRHLSYHDSLTGLYNRRYLEEALSRMDSVETMPFSVIMGDVNGLKITNDVFGHEAGDALLKHVAHLLEKYCRKGDVIARWGGDEFVVLMPRTSLKEAEEAIAKIKNDHIVLDQGGLRLSISLGCATRGAAENGIRAVIREAEENMYHQKLLDGKSYRNTIINTLLATLYEKSMETEEHSKRLEASCHSIGQKLQLSSKELDELSLLAILHDIGKVGVNPNILKKPAPLTSAEWDEMKRHPEIGYRIVQATPELANVADFILSHHERWNGTGYPRGLREKEIPLVCRVLAVADAYDAMTNDRVYRNAKSGEAAVFELKKYAGTQFDPEIVSLFVQILQTKGKAASRMAPARSKDGGL